MDYKNGLLWWTNALRGRRKSCCFAYGPRAIKITQQSIKLRAMFFNKIVSWMELNQKVPLLYFNRNFSTIHWWEIEYMLVGLAGWTYSERRHPYTAVQTSVISSWIADVWCIKPNSCRNPSTPSIIRWTHTRPPSPQTDGHPPFLFIL